MVSGKKMLSSKTMTKPVTGDLSSLPRPLPEKAKIKGFRTGLRSYFLQEKSKPAVGLEPKWLEPKWLRRPLPGPKPCFSKHNP